MPNLFKALLTANDGALLDKLVELPQPSRLDVFDNLKLPIEPPDAEAAEPAETFSMDDLGFEGQYTKQMQEFMYRAWNNLEVMREGIKGGGPYLLFEEADVTLPADGIGVEVTAENWQQVEDIQFVARTSGGVPATSPRISTLSLKRLEATSAGDDLTSPSGDDLRATSIDVGQTYRMLIGWKDANTLVLSNTGSSDQTLKIQIGGFIYGGGQQGIGISGLSEDSGDLVVTLTDGQEDQFPIPLSVGGEGLDYYPWALGLKYDQLISGTLNAGVSGRWKAYIDDGSGGLEVVRNAIGAEPPDSDRSITLSFGDAPANIVAGDQDTTTIDLTA